MVPGSSGHRLSGDVDDVGLVNRFLERLSVRNFSPATRRAYSYDLLNFLRFCAGRALTVATLEPMDVFDYLDWQQGGRASSAGSTVVMLADRRRAAPATMNRRIAAVRGLFEYAVLAGTRPDSPIPSARRSSGARAVRRGLLGHLGPGRPRSGGRLVRTPRLLPESLDLAEVADSPPMIDVNFGVGLAAPDRTRSLVNRMCSSSSSDKPFRSASASASASTGTSPAADTRSTSSNTAAPRSQACDNFT